MLRGISGFLVVLFIVLLTGCGDEQGVIVGNDDSTLPVANWNAGIVNEDLIVSFGNGKTATGIESYQELVAENIAGAKEVNITFNSQPVAEVQGAKMADIRIPAFGYQIRLSAETHMLYGCINKVVPHVGIAISKIGQSGTLANLHLAIWKNNGRVCGAVLASVNNNNGFCWSMCSPKLKDMQKGVSSALLYVGIPILFVESLAAIITPVAVALSSIGL